MLEVSPQQHCIHAKVEKLQNVAIIIGARGQSRALKVMKKSRCTCMSDPPSFTAPLYSQVVNVLRSQLAQLEEMKKERETLEGEIKAVTFDMSTSFLTALSQDGTINEEQLSLSQLDQLYGAYNQRVQTTLRSQEELLGQIQVYPVCFYREYMTRSSKAGLEAHSGTTFSLYGWSFHL